MKITKKRILVAGGTLLGIALLAAGGAALWFWESVSVLLANREMQGESGAIPAPRRGDLPPPAEGEADWVCWRGPKGDGRALVRGIRKDWSGGLQKLWSVDYLCQGAESGTWSAPVVRGNRLVVMGRDRKNDHVFCLDPADGSLLWRASYPAAANDAYGEGPRATPWIDGDRVYTFGRSGDLACWRLADGGKVWSRNVSAEGGVENTWGHASSPLVTESLVVVAGGGAARTLAYDKRSGELRWKTGAGLGGYAALVRMPLDGRDAALHFHGKGLCAVDLAEGKELWNFPWTTNFDVNATTPVEAGGRVFITSGYGTGGALLRVGASSAEVLWKNKAIASIHSDPHPIGGHLYGYSGDSMQNRGHFKCLDLETGKEKWSTGEMGWGTCVQADGHLLCMDIKGNLYLMRPDPERFVKVAEMREVFGKVRGAAWTVPVLANGRLFVRFVQTLIAFDVAEKAAQG